MGHGKGDPREALKARLRPGYRVVDVGANDGAVVECALRKGAEVVAIEPNPACWPKLEALGEQYGAQLLTVHRVGCDAQPGTKALQLNPQTPRGTYVVGLEPDTSGTLETPMQRLDDLVHEADFVKIDAQGFDAAVLRGSPRLLRRCPVWAVEVWPAGLRAAVDSPEAIHDLLTAAGLQVQWMDGTPCDRDEIAPWMATKQVYTNWLGVRV